MRLFSLYGFLTILFLNNPAYGQEKPATPAGQAGVELIVLGNVQDGGAPHMGCQKSCCAPLYENPNPKLKVVSLGLLDGQASKYYLFEATPDIAIQMALLRDRATFQAKGSPDGIFITHAHIGHYSGLMYLGRESMNAEKVPVYSLPRFSNFISDNGPWDQLVRLKNIELRPMRKDVPVVLSENIQVRALQVPHRDEYSETAGFEISGPEKKVLFIPDIDKWEKWEESLVDKVRTTDLVFIDATFYNNAEIGYRDVSEIPHPFVHETLTHLENIPQSLRHRVYFIHMNHTNPLLDPESAESKKVIALGYGIARFGDHFKL